jgi:hypothetical protein
MRATAGNKEARKALIKQKKAAREAERVAAGLPPTGRALRKIQNAEKKSMAAALRMMGGLTMDDRAPSKSLSSYLDNGVCGPVYPARERDVILLIRGPYRGDDGQQRE